MDRKPIFSLTKKDFSIEFTCGSGKGGQNKNRRHTAVRIKHEPSKCEAYCCDERSQHQNLEKAFRTIAKRMEPWIRLEVARIDGYEKIAKENVDRAMRSGNLRIEVMNDGKWEVENV